MLIFQICRLDFSEGTQYWILEFDIGDSFFHFYLLSFHFYSYPSGGRGIPCIRKKNQLLILNKAYL